jgi:hypothetical protein
VSEHTAVGRPVLIVGSYPPIPVAGAPATIREVRRAWAAGQEVTVVSPRLSAAHLAVPIHGVLAGRRLANVRRVTGADHLVMVVEEGFPFPAGPVPLQMATAAVILRAWRKFRHVRLVRAGSPSLPDQVWGRLVDAADEVVEEAPGPVQAGVTPLGPPETTVSERAALIAERAARRALGTHGPTVRSWIEAFRRSVRRIHPPRDPY